MLESQIMTPRKDCNAIEAGLGGLELGGDVHRCAVANEVNRDNGTFRPTRQDALDVAFPGQRLAIEADQDVANRNAGIGRRGTGQHDPDAEAMVGTGIECGDADSERSLLGQGDLHMAIIFLGRAGRGVDPDADEAAENQIAEQPAGNLGSIPCIGGLIPGLAA